MANGTISFKNNIFSALESAGNASIVVTRSGADGVGAAAQITVSTLDGTGVAGTHYTATSQAVSWAAGENGDKTVLVPVLDTVPAARVTWDDNADNEAGYEIQRSVGGGAFQTAGSVGANITEFIDQSIDLGQSLQYRVRSFNAGGQSAWATSVTWQSTEAIPRNHTVNLTLSAISGAAYGPITSATLTILDAHIPDAFALQHQTDFLTAGTFTHTYPGLSPAARALCRSQLKARGYTHIYVYAVNENDYGGPSFDFYTDVPGYRALLNELVADGLFPVVWLNPDDAPTNSARTTPELQNRLTAFVPQIDDLVSSYCLGLELDEYWSDAKVNDLGLHLRSLTQKKIAVHQLPQQHDLALGAWCDYLILQTNNPSSPPTPSTVANRVQTAIAAVNKPVVVGEYNVSDPEATSVLLGDAGIAAGAVGFGNGGTPFFAAGEEVEPPPPPPTGGVVRYTFDSGSGISPLEDYIPGQSESGSGGWLGSPEAYEVNQNLGEVYPEISSTWSEARAQDSIGVADYITSVSGRLGNLSALNYLEARVRSTDPGIAYLARFGVFGSGSPGGGGGSGGSPLIPRFEIRRLWGPGSNGFFTGSVNLGEDLSWVDPNEQYAVSLSVEGDPVNLIATVSDSTGVRLTLTNTDASGPRLTAEGNAGFAVVGADAVMTAFQVVPLGVAIAADQTFTVFKNASTSLTTILDACAGVGLFVVSVSGESNCVVAVDQLGQSVTVTPTTGTSGTAAASFDYLIEDSSGNQDTGTVTLDVVNSRPVADEVDAEVSADINGQAVVDLTKVFSDPDGDPLTFSKVSDPDEGSLEIVGANAVFTAGPSPGVFTAVVRATDNDAVPLSVDATLTLEVAAPEGAYPDTFEEDYGVIHILHARLLENDVTIGNFTVTGVSNPVNCSVSNKQDKVAVFPTGAPITASFDYTISDGTTNYTATVTIQVRKQKRTIF